MKAQRIARTVLGVTLLLAALILALPVGVNLPDSWPGAAIIALLLISGALLIYRGMHRAKEPT
jgi:hypothetical protein